VSAALFEKHPYLKDPGPETGYDTWTMSIKYQFAKYEVAVNQRKSNKDINFLPDIPIGQRLFSTKENMKEIHY